MTPVKIGNCELWCGDALDILPRLAAGSVDAVVTDPPYGIDYESSHKFSIKYGKIKGDDKPFDPRPLLSFGNVILWGGNNFANQLPIGGWICWDKRLSEDADKILGSPFELAWCSRRKLFRIVRLLHGGAKNADAPHGDVANQARFHPTQKPVALMRQCLNFLPDAETILDPYVGSGSTGIACIQLGRKFIGIEIDPGYFDMACRRIEAALRHEETVLFAPVEKQTGLFAEEA